MGVFEEVVVNVKSAVDAIGRKTGELVGVSKLKINEAEINNDIKKAYEKLGKLVYENKKLGVSQNDVYIYDECIKKIDELNLQLEAVRKEISKNDNKVFCNHCGCKNAKESCYCCKCGYKLESNCECNE